MVKAGNPFVIERASESRLEWWTGDGWTEDEAEAKRFATAPHPNEETGDESAAVAQLDPPLRRRPSRQTHQARGRRH